jgi:DnaK suppressor protein
MRYDANQHNVFRDHRKAEALQKLLTRHEAALNARRQLLREDIAPEPGESRDAIESSADNFSRAVSAALLESAARTVQSIEDALRRLRTGIYGRCLDCASPIPAVRLQVLPFAERCRDCQEQCDSEPRYLLVA